MMQTAHRCKSTFDGVVIVHRRLPVGTSEERKPSLSSRRGTDILKEAFAPKIGSDQGDLNFVGGEREQDIDPASKVTRSQVSRDIFFEAWRTAMRDYESKRRWSRPDQNPCQRCRNARTICVKRDLAHRTWDPLVCQGCKGAKKQCSINAQFGVETLARGLGLPISWVENSVRNGWHTSKRHDFRFEDYQVRQRFSFEQLLRIEDGEALETVISTFMEKPRKSFKGRSVRRSRRRVAESSAAIAAIAASAPDRPPRGSGVVNSETPLASEEIASSAMGDDPTDPEEPTESDEEEFKASTEDAPHLTRTNPEELSDPDVEVLLRTTTGAVVSAPTESSRRLTPNDQDKPMVMEEELATETLGPVVTASIETPSQITQKIPREVRDMDEEGISPSTKRTPMSSESGPHLPAETESNSTQTPPLPLSIADVLPILSVLFHAVPALQTLRSQLDELARGLEVQSEECRRLNELLRVSQTNMLQTVQRGRLAEQSFARYGEVDIPALLAKQELQDENIERVMKENSELTTRISDSERVHEELRQALEAKTRELEEAELNAIDWRERAVGQRRVVDQLELERLAFRADVFYTQSYLAELLHRTELPAEELRRLVEASDGLRRALEKDAESPTRLARQDTGLAPTYDRDGQQDRQSTKEIEGWFEGREEQQDRLVSNRRKRTKSHDSAETSVSSSKRQKQ